jgi:hypothetical protein
VDRCGERWVERLGLRGGGLWVVVGNEVLREDGSFWGIVSCGGLVRCDAVNWDDVYAGSDIADADLESATRRVGARSLPFKLLISNASATERRNK